MTPTQPTSLSHQIESELRAARSTSRCPSIVAAVSRDGALLGTGVVGYLTGRADAPVADPESLYRIGSITKTVTAIAVLQQVFSGLIDLDAPVGDVLPELTVDVARTSARALLMHGSGLLAEPSGAWWERSEGRSWQQLLPQLQCNRDLAGRFHYSNSGYAVLGQLVARCTGRSWWEVAHQDVLTALDMGRTTYDAPQSAAPGLAVHPDADLLHHEPAHDTAAMAPAGQLWSTPRDICRLGEFLAHGNETVLPEELRERMSVPGLIDDVPGRPWARSYGLGVDVTERGGERFIGHGGSMPGFVAALRVRVADGASVAVFANSTVGHSPDLAYRLLDLVDRVDDAASPVLPETAGGAVDHPARDLLGRWFWGPRPYILRARSDGGLDLVPEDTGRGSRFTRAGRDAWIGHDEYFAGEALRAVRGAGTIYLDLATFRLTRAPYDPGSDIPGGVDPAGWY